MVEEFKELSANAAARSSPRQQQQLSRLLWRQYDLLDGIWMSFHVSLQWIQDIWVSLIIFQQQNKAKPCLFGCLNRRGEEGSTASPHPASHSPTAARPDSGMMANESQVAEAIIAQLVCFPPFPRAALSTVQPCSSDEGERANTGSDNSAAGLNPPTHEPTLKNWQVPYVT